MVGGFVGKIQNTSEIQNCSVEAEVSGTNNVGGFIGQTASSSVIKNCQAKGSVTGTEYRIGGFIGNVSAQTNVQNCFAETDVTGGDYRVGGFAGSLGGEGNKVIKNCYSKGTVNNTSKFTGGFIGTIEHANDSQTTKIDSCLSYSAVNAENCVGSFIGAFINPEDTAETRFNKITITNCLTDFYKEGVSAIGGWYAAKDDEEAQVYDLSKWANNIQVVKPNTVTMHTGLSGQESDSITFDMTFKLDLKGITEDFTGESAYSTINNFMDMLNRKSTEIGTISSRLESSLDSIYSGIDNLSSALSVIKDADIAKASSQYLRQQILQNASATLISTTNQTPAMALKLIGLE